MSNKHSLVLYNLNEISVKEIYKYREKLPQDAWAYLLQTRKLIDEILIQTKQLTWQFIAEHSCKGISIACFQEKTGLDIVNYQLLGDSNTNTEYDKKNKIIREKYRHYFLDISEDDWVLFFYSCNFGTDRAKSILISLIDNDHIFKELGVFDKGFNQERFRESLNNNRTITAQETEKKKIDAIKDNLQNEKNNIEQAEKNKETTLTQEKDFDENDENNAEELSDNIDNAIYQSAAQTKTTQQYNTNADDESSLIMDNEVMMARSDDSCAAFESKMSDPDLLDT